MAKNRKSQSVGMRFGPALKAFLLCLVIGGAGLGYVWQKDQIGRLGKQKKSRENRLSLLDDQNVKLRNQLAILRSPKPLGDRIQEMKLGLVPMQPTQIWRLAEPMADAPRSGHEGQFATQVNHGQTLP